MAGILKSFFAALKPDPAASYHANVEQSAILHRNLLGFIDHHKKINEHMSKNESRPPVVINTKLRYNNNTTWPQPSSQPSPRNPIGTASSYPNTRSPAFCNISCKCQPVPLLLYRAAPLSSLLLWCGVCIATNYLPNKQLKQLPQLRLQGRPQQQPIHNNNYGSPLPPTNIFYGSSELLHVMCVASEFCLLLHSPHLSSYHRVKEASACEAKKNGQSRASQREQHRGAGAHMI